MEDRTKKRVAAGGGAAAVLALAAGLVSVWEGTRPDVYKDIVGVPTVCYGHTGKDVAMGQPRRTREECQRLLEGDLADAYAAVQQCITHPVKPETAAALTSFAFNVGRGGVCGSKVQRHANRGEIAQACGQLMRWVYAGGKRVPGLVNRRQAEYRVCMKPLQERGQ